MTSTGRIASLPANTWTKVLWGGYPGFLTYKAYFSNQNTTIRWRRYGATLPPYSEGTHYTNLPFGAVVVGASADGWFYSPLSLA